MPKWDWTHTNNVYYTEGSKIVPTSQPGLGKVIKDVDTKLWGVCTSKSCFWLSKCFKGGGPMKSRDEFDGGQGGGITPASIAAQAAHLSAGRYVAKTGGNFQIDFHSRVGESYNLVCAEAGTDSGFMMSHAVWIQKVMDTPGAYVATLVGANYLHSVAIWNQSPKWALFDAAGGQYSDANQAIFTDELKWEYFPATYRGLSDWDLFTFVPR